MFVVDSVVHTKRHLKTRSCHCKRLICCWNVHFIHLPLWLSVMFTERRHRTRNYWPFRSLSIDNAGMLPLGKQVRSLCCTCFWWKTISSYKTQHSIVAELFCLLCTLYYDWQQVDRLHHGSNNSTSWIASPKWQHRKPARGILLSFIYPLSCAQHSGPLCCHPQNPNPRQLFWRQQQMSLRCRGWQSSSQLGRVQSPCLRRYWKAWMPLSTAIRYCILEEVGVLCRTLFPSLSLWSVSPAHLDCCCC